MDLIKVLAALSLILPAALPAGDATHVFVETRRMSQEAQAELQSRKPAPLKTDEEDPGDLAFAGYLFDRYPPVYYSAAHHWLANVTILNENQYTLELEDGSSWKINRYDGTKALNWRANDPLTITQNTRWFSKHDYRIINQTNGTSVEANLFLGPLEQGEYSRFIVAISQNQREIELNDHTRWEISYLDSAIFKDWAVGDYVILGTNSNTSIWDSGSDALLINVNLNNATRAKQF